MAREAARPDRAVPFPGSMSCFLMTDDSMMGNEGKGSFNRFA
jgi:hypothetical protein